MESNKKLEVVDGKLRSTEETQQAAHFSDSAFGPAIEARPKLNESTGSHTTSTFKPLPKTKTQIEYEEALLTLTKEEKEFGLMHTMSFSSVKGIKDLKAAYLKYHTFSFGKKLKAIWSLLFGKVTPELFSYVVDQAMEENNLTDPLDHSFNPLPFTYTKETTMEEVLNNVKARDSNRMADDLDKSIEKLTPPKIVETIRMSGPKKRSPAKKTTVTPSPAIKKGTARRNPPKKTK